MVVGTKQVQLAFAFVVVPIGWRVLGFFLRRFFYRKLTVLEELKQVGKPRSDGQRVKGSAVVCGGSISGLLAARVCADHFESVIVVESEEWLASDEGTSTVCDEMGIMKPNNGRINERTRVSQYESIHFYQPLSLKILRALFPEIDEEFRKRDVQVKAACFNIHITSGSLRDPKPEDFPSGKCPESFYATRETYEKTLRCLLRKRPNVQWMAGTVVGIKFAPNDFERVEVVTIRKHDLTNVDVAASLVIDCTGKTQAGLKWLKHVHEGACKVDPRKYQRIPEGKLLHDKLRLKYDIQGVVRGFFFNITPSMASRLPIPGGYANAGWLLTVLSEPGADNRCAIMTKFEGNRIRFGAFGWGNPQFPETPADIPDYLQSLNCKVPIQDWVYDVIKVLQEDEGYTIDRQKMPACTYIRYHLAPFVPKNFIALGDAVMSVNPVRGQGCTKAAMGAVILDSALRSAGASTDLPPDLSSYFFAKHHAIVKGIWSGMKSADYSYNTTIPVEGETLDSERFMYNFTRYYMRLAVKDKVADQTSWRVRMFLAPPTDMFHPFLLYKVGWLAVREWLGFDAN